MSFAGTKTPCKPVGEGKWQVPQRRQEKSGVMEYYLEGELKDRFCRMFPNKTNTQMMELFGISFSTLQRFKRELGLQKNMKAVRKIQTEMTIKKCEENGYYDSLRGKAPSEACIEATKQMFAEGFHPLKQLKKKNPRRYKKLMQQRSENRQELERGEAMRVRIGLPQRTKLHRPHIKFTKSQLCIAME